MSYPVAAHSPSPSCESPSPSASTSALPDQPPRKRSRSEMTSEERKEARAHRNRIAAQNSRDRRKAQFGWLERRVAELEEENRRLRAGLPTAPPPPPPPYVPPQNLIPLLTHPSLVPSPQVIPVLEDAQRAAQDRERERENEELKERIRTLERGWDAVVKALQQQGLPTGLPSPAVTSTPTTPTTTTTTLVTPVSPAQTSLSSPSTSSIPTTAPPPSATTTTTSQLSTGFPSPAPSQLSEFDSAPTASSDDVSARHLAAGGHILSVSAQSVVTPAVYPSPAVTYIDDDSDDDARMEDLFREILVEDSAVPSASPLIGSLQASTPLSATPAAAAQAQVGPKKDQLETKGEDVQALGKRKREQDEEEERIEKTKENEANQSLSFDGLDAGLDFTFGWTDPTTSTNAAVPAPLSPEELQQMLHQFEVGSTLFPNDLGLEVGAMDMSLPLDLGTWNATAMTGVF